jgi:23S rRNA (cytidine1920-2'-O)/16S rRNA (cytidine1409-2'-O)-methyltransferase
LSRKGRVRLRALVALVRERFPEVDAEAAIRAGLVVVDGRVQTNPASLVRVDAAVRIRRAHDGMLRGEAKLAAALRLFGVAVMGRTALDLGAAAGGFTRVLVRAGARRVYAVDAGFGQLLGSLHAHPAVVNLERTNLGELTTTLVPERIDVVVADLSYVSLVRALPQLEGRVAFTPNADLVALVKPQFELGLARPPTEAARLTEAAVLAASGAERAGWTVVRTEPSPVIGRRGARELLLHARRRRWSQPDRQL